MIVQLNPFDPAYRKYGVVVGAAVLAALNALLPIEPPDWKPWTDLGILLLTAYGVQQARNAEPTHAPTP